MGKKIKKGIGEQEVKVVIPEIVYELVNKIVDEIIDHLNTQPQTEEFRGEYIPIPKEDTNFVQTVGIPIKESTTTSSQDTPEQTESDVQEWEEDMQEYEFNVIRPDDCGSCASDFFPFVKQLLNEREKKVRRDGIWQRGWKDFVSEYKRKHKVEKWEDEFFLMLMNNRSANQLTDYIKQLLNEREREVRKEALSKLKDK